jgi:hypothetical protein
MQTITENLVEIHVSPPNRWREFAAALRPCGLGDTPNFDLNELFEMKRELLAWAEAENVDGTVESAGGVAFSKAELCR